MINEEEKKVIKSDKPQRPCCFPKYCVLCTCLAEMFTTEDHIEL